jgi:hypothetical protein
MFFGLAMGNPAEKSPAGSDGGPVPGERSMYSVVPSGCKAWATALKRSGLPLMVWDKPFSPRDKPPSPALLVLMSPESGFDAKAADTLLSWAAEGHTVLLLDDFAQAGGTQILRRLELPPLGWGDNLPTNVLHLAPSADKRLAFRVAAPLRSRTKRRIQSIPVIAHGGRILLEDAQQRAVLVSLPYGRGKLILGTASDLAENRYLHGPPNDNAQFLANLLTLEKKPVLINEFVHGYTESSDLMSYYWRKTPVGEMLTSLGLGFLFLLWLGLSRWPPAPSFGLFSRPSAGFEKSESSSPPSEAATDGMTSFVDSLANFYACHQAAPLALAPLLRRIDALLKTRFGVPPGEEVLPNHLLAGSPAPYSNESRDWPEALRKARAVVERQQRFPARDVLRLSQQLIRIQEALQHGPRFPA